MNMKNNGHKQLTCQYENCKTRQLLMFGGYVQVRESFCVQVISWVDTFLTHSDTRAILPWYEGN